MSKKLEEYKKHKELNERMHNYKVDMGFGLHVGWGIEVNYLNINLNTRELLDLIIK